MTTNIYIYSLGTVASLTSYDLLGVAQAVMPVLRGKSFAESGVRAGDEGKYFYVDNGSSKRVTVFAGKSVGAGWEGSVLLGTPLVARGALRPLRMLVTYKTEREEAEAVLGVCGILRAFGGDEVDLELRADFGGEFYSVLDLEAEYGTMGLDAFAEGSGFDGSRDNKRVFDA